MTNDLSNQSPDRRRVMAGVVVALLGLAIAVATAPFLIGLLGGPILALLFAPLYARLASRLSPRPAATLVVITAVLAIFIPGIAITVLFVNEAPAVLSGPGVERILAAISTLRLGAFAVGPELAKTSGDLVSWGSHQAISLVSGLTRLAVNLLIAFLGLYFLLLSGDRPWRYAVRFLPFSAETAERLRTRFHDVTRATIVGVVVTALLQGSIVGGSFALLGLDHPLLWGAVTGIVSVLPVLGSALVWLPGTAVLLLDHRYGAAVTLALIGFVVASNIDNVVRPIIIGRVSHIHPLVAVVGAFAGMRYFGLLGVLLGPLALVYFIELVRAFEEEYVVAPRA